MKTTSALLEDNIYKVSKSNLGCIGSSYIYWI